MYAIKLSKTNHSIKVREINRKFSLKHQTSKINLKHSGIRGPQGEQGPQGEPGSSTADKNFVHNFTVSSVVPVNHNLNKYPAVSVIDSAGDEVIGEVYYMNTTQLIVRFVNPFSGRVTCN